MNKKMDKENTLENLLFSYIGGSVILLIGLIVLYDTFTNQSKDDHSPLHPYRNGLVGGCVFVICGIIVIIMKIIGY